MSKTKIVVLQLKEIVYTAIFIALGVLLILLLVFMFVNKKGDRPSEPTKQSSMQEQKYIAGVYTSSIQLTENILNLEVIVDESQISSVRLLNLDEATSTMYPLIGPTLVRIEEQLINGANLEQLEYEADAQYTHMLLVHAIETTLTKAEPVNAPVY